MSDPIKHECGIALIRLLKPLAFYQEKYGSCFYGLNKMYLLMEKQHNRGQDGAGIATIKLDTNPGQAYISVERSCSANPIGSIFKKINKEISKAHKNHRDQFDDPDWLKNNLRFAGELVLGHLRYGTFGNNDLEACHPFVRNNNWISRNLVVAGNFNLTNVDELFDLLLHIGQHPKGRSDSVTILEKIGHFLDDENERLYRKYRKEKMPSREIAEAIAQNLDIQQVLHNACKRWDGGYVIAGLIGHGDAFVLRDPSGIRPAFYYRDEEVAVVASERPVIQTAFNVPFDLVQEITPGNALIIRKNGEISEKPFIPQCERRACSFERIYFSRGTDADIYQERLSLGRHLTGEVLDAIDHDLENTVFSFIPNTAETCFLGMVDEIHTYCDRMKRQRILERKGQLTPEELDAILAFRPRVSKVAVKDVKLRTFITEDSARKDMVAHVYDITYGTIRSGTDNLVVIDDSIVRGTTLRESILRILDRLGPKRIVLVSSAPQIRYPDCYGIDMAKLGDFVAFKAAVALLRERNRESVLSEVLEKCRDEIAHPSGSSVNWVRKVYEPFTVEEISAKIADLLRPPDCRAEIRIIYQRIENLHAACPGHLGDWYFTGRYPTPGGNRVVNQALINFMEGVDRRAY